MIKVFKIGGKVIDDTEALDLFIKAFAAVGGKKLLVHGGGKTATSVSEAMGIKPQLVEGRRITDAKTLDVVVMVYAGLINKTVTAKLNASGCTALGLCGADASLVVSQKRAVTGIDYGFVGDPRPDGVNTTFLSSLVYEGMVPVIAPITTDGRGRLLNTNADTVAQVIASALSETEETELIYCFEHKGVLMDMENENSVISVITGKEYPKLREKGIVTDGMYPKIDNAFSAVEKGVPKVRICSYWDFSYGTVIM